MTAMTTLADNPPGSNSYGVEAQVSGAVGTGNPWAATLKGQLGNKIKLQPYIGIRGINRHNSGTDEDANFTYSGKAPLSNSLDYSYKSHSHTYRKGIGFNYGLTATYLLNPSNTITASVSGDIIREDQGGNMTESNYMPGQAALNNPFSTVLTEFDGNTHANTLEASAGYRFRFNNSHANFPIGFDVDYTFSRSSNDCDTRQKIVQQTGFSDYALNSLNTEAVTRKHRLQGTWLTAIKGTQINLAAFYEDRKLESNDHQSFQDTNGTPTITPLDHQFRHQYQTVGTYVSARSRVKDVVFNARLEYDYTDMEGKHLNDLLPMASVEWNINHASNLNLKYARRLIRPGLEELNPAQIRGNYTLRYGKADMEGIHANNAMMTYRIILPEIIFTTTLNHIFVQDGFNAIWMEKNGMRISTWGNEGVRRAWSLAPEAEWNISGNTKLNLKAEALWDKRIAYAIHMSKEHWGMTLHTALQQTLPLDISMNLHATYSEGNTIDLYSHEAHSYQFGATFSRPFLSNRRLTASLEYYYRKYPRTIITQGAYVGDAFIHPSNRNTAVLSLTYKL